LSGYCKGANLFKICQRQAVGGEPIKCSYVHTYIHTHFTDPVFVNLGRPKNRWEDDVKSDITNKKITNWKDCIRNRPKWKEFVEKAKTSLKL